MQNVKMRVIAAAILALAGAGAHAECSTWAPCGPARKLDFPLPADSASGGIRKAEPGITVGGNGPGQDAPQNRPTGCAAVLPLFVNMQVVNNNDTYSGVGVTGYALCTNGVISLNISVPGASQCHSGGCNSTYTPVTVALPVEQPVAGLSPFLAKNYQGKDWLQAYLQYDGMRTILVSTYEPPAVETPVNGAGGG